MRSEYLTEHDIFQQAAKQLFDSEVQRLKQKDSADEVSLNAGQIEQLATKIRLLPEDWQDALLLRYGCGFDTDLSGDILDDPDTSDKILYVEDILASGMHVSGISKESLAESCRIVLQNLHRQVKHEQQNNPISASKKLDRKIQRLIREKSKVRHLTFNVIARRVAVVFLALLLASTVTVLSVGALREKFFEWLFSIFPTHTRVEFVDTTSPSGVDYAGRLDQYAPTYLPEGFVLVDTVETDTRYKLYYANPDELYIVFEVRLITDQKHANVNTENDGMEEIVINGKSGYYVNGSPTHMVFWSDEAYLFSVICDTTKDEAIKIAKSTKLK